MAYELSKDGPPDPFAGLLLDAGGLFLLPDPAVLSDLLSCWSVILDTDNYDDRSYYTGAAALDAAIAIGADWRRHGWAAHLEYLGLAAEHVPDAVEALSVRKVLWTRVWRPSVAGLRSIVDTRIPVGIVSNSDGTVESQLRESGICQVGPGPLSRVDAVIDSSVVGTSKPDSRIFHLGADAIGCPPEECVYVGDLIHFDIAGAWGAGLWPVHFDPYRVCPHRGAHDHVSELDDLLEMEWKPRGAP